MKLIIQGFSHARKQKPTTSLDDYFVLETTGKGRSKCFGNECAYKIKLKAEYFNVLDTLCGMKKGLQTVMFKYLVFSL